MMEIQEIIDQLIVPPGKKINLARDYDPGFKDESIDKEAARQRVARGVEKLSEFQDKLYARNQFSMLLIFQAMDAAGKDGVIKHVMTGLNPQGVQVFSFKHPSAEELDHDYLWRCVVRLPERGRIGIFNRSYYEDVLIVRVHPEILEAQQLPEPFAGKDIWKRRFEQINNFEKHLTENGTIVRKFFLNISRDEQKKRFMDRIDQPDKNWKFAAGDVKERQHWDEYMHAYEEMLSHTSTEAAPWYVIPADAKWFTRLCVAGIIYKTMEDLNPTYPEIDDAKRAELARSRKMLESEG